MTMKNKMLKRTLAGMLATTMVLSMATVAFAEDPTSGTGSGTGSFEGHVKKDVTKVTLPTASADTFAYKMDPEGLIAATNNANYSGASFEKDANVYFLSSANTYTKDSAKLKVVNKGTADVDVTVTAKMDAENDKIAMADSGTFAEDDTAAKLYLGLIVANKQAEAVTASDDSTASVTVGLRGNTDNYEIKANGTSYEYTAKEGVADTAWNSFEFGLTGACNPKGDYSDEALAASNVTVTWSYAAHDDATELLAANAVSKAAPSIAVTEYKLQADTPVTIKVNLGGEELAATKVSSVKNGSTALATSDWSYADGVVTITASKVNAIITGKTAKTYTVVFNDTAKTSVNIKLDPTEAITD